MIGRLLAQIKRDAFEGKSSINFLSHGKSQEYLMERPRVTRPNSQNTLLFISCKLASN